MKIHPQTIYQAGRPKFIVLPIKEYMKLIKACQDYEDIQEAKEYFESKLETFPLEVATALSEEQNPIKVYREYRGLSQTNLANKVSVSKQYISQLENGQRQGTAKVLKKIAEVLDIDISDLTIV